VGGPSVRPRIIRRQDAAIVGEPIMPSLGHPVGKTGRGLVRHFEKHEIPSVIDRTKLGLDSGEVLGPDRVVPGRITHLRPR
jgi:hypothetical protein